MSVKIIEGFDKRDWNGYLPATVAALYKFAGIKISQARHWTFADIAVLQKQWNRANRVYDLARLPFHFWYPPLLGVDAEKYGRDQAKNFFNSIRDLFNNDYGELPPAIDVECKRPGMASGKKRVTCLRACLDKTESLWGQVPMIYTAGWYWDVYIHPYVGDWKYWEKYELWEADPPPDTPIAGWGKTNSIQQVLMSALNMPGFPGKVDINETTQAWLDKFLKPEPPPPPPPIDCGPAQKAVLNQVVGFTQDLIDSL